MKLKRVCSLVLAGVLSLGMVVPTCAADDKATQAADALHDLGLFSGIGVDAEGNPIYDLDRTPSRNEAITMLVALLGKTEEAQNGTWETPFTDVADWAKPYVGYAYANGLTSGTSATTYGGEAPISASQYLTFVLTALGYKSGVDFQWDKAWELSDKLGVTDGRYSANSGSFVRGDVVLISSSALGTNMKGTDSTMLQTLHMDKANAKKEPPFTLTAFGDKWLHEYLMSLKPDDILLGPERTDGGSYLDKYHYYDRDITKKIREMLEGRYEFRDKENGWGETTMTGMFTRVETVGEHERFSPWHISVEVFWGDGTYSDWSYYIKMPED